MVADVPHQYMEVDAGFSRLEAFMRVKQRNYKYDTIGIGYGQKSDFTNSKEAKQVPGAIYNQDTKNSIAYLSKKNHPKTMTGFYNPHSAYEKICYDGMQAAFLGTQSPGPCANNRNKFVHTSLTRKA